MTIPIGKWNLDIHHFAKTDRKGYIDGKQRATLTDIFNRTNIFLILNQQDCSCTVRLPVMFAPLFKEQIKQIHFNSYIQFSCIVIRIRTGSPSNGKRPHSFQGRIVVLYLFYPLMMRGRSIWWWGQMERGF